MNPFARVWSQVKGLAMRWGSSLAFWPARTYLGGTAYDYAATAADGRGNAAVAACVRWVARTFPEAPLIVQTRGRDGHLAPQPAHPLQQLLERPNPYYSGLHLWSATLADYLLTGNAYWLKVRSGSNRVVELWWVPSALVEPVWPSDGSAFITHYAYTVNGQAQPWPLADVVHFRDGFDPQNVRKGLSPLAALAREIFTDNEAANWTASLLRNMGVPGVIIAPKGEVSMAADAAERVKNEFSQRFTGDRRGMPLVFGAATDVTVLGFSPEQMTLREVRRIPEERITAIFGVPAVVVGLGAGLDKATYSNVAQAREAAYESHLIPLQRLLLAELHTQLVPDFGDPATLRLLFDLRQVRVLQDDQNALAVRISEQLKSGRLTINEARQAEGREPLKGGDVLLVPTTLTATAPLDLLAAPVPSTPVPLRVVASRQLVGGTKAEPLQPSGTPLAPVAVVTFSTREQARLLALWDAAMSADLTGLLDATVDASKAADGPEWHWEPAAHRYRDAASGRFVGQDQMIALRGEWQAVQAVRAGELAARLASGGLPVDAWETAMRALVKETYGVQYLLGHGGRNTMAAAQWGEVGDLVKRQYGFLGDFAAAVSAGELSEAQTAARAAQYVASSSAAFEQGRARSWNLRLPAYPGDGSSACHAQCRCAWSYSTGAEGRPEATWRLGGTHHCATCTSRASAWAPFVAVEAGAA